MSTDEAYKEVLRRLDEANGRIESLEINKEVPMSEETETTEVKTPWGSIKGKRTAEFITILLAVGVGILAYAFWVHSKESGENNKQLAEVLEKFSRNQDNHTKALRAQTCIFAQPPEKRESEFRDPNSLCNRLSQ